MQKLIQYFKDTAAEIQHITWPTREELLKQFVVVLVITSIIVMILYYIDIMYVKLINYIKLIV